MLKHRFAAVFTWRTLGATLIAAVVIVPWLDLDRGKVGPGCPGASREAPVAPSPGELPPADASAWIPPLSDPMRQVLAAGFSDELRRAKNVSSAAAPPAPPRLLAPASAEPLANAGTNNLRLASAAMDAAPGELQGPSLGGPLSSKPAPPVSVVIDSEPALAATPWSAAPAARTEALEQIAAEADRHTRHGFELAGRGAPFAARAEFIAALRVVAQGLDAERQTTAHSRALASGLTALREAEDFIPRGGHLEANLDLKQIVAGHTSDVLKGEGLSRLTPMVALRRYHTYAQEQFAAAAAHEVAGSMALHGLGKLHVAMATRRGAIDIVAAEPKAMTFFQAAAIVYPNNALATNELGVLLARAGHYADARAALEHSVSVSPQPDTWHNLATVYQRLNRGDLARQAEARAMVDNPAASDAVKWVLPEAFAQAHTDVPQSDPPVNTTASQATKPLPAAPVAAPATKPALFDMVAKPTAGKTPALAEAKAQTSLSSLFGVPTKRATESVAAAEEQASSRPAVFDTAAKPAPSKTPAVAETKAPPSFSSLLGLPTKRATENVAAAEEKAPGKPAVFGPSSKPAAAAPATVAATPQHKPALFDTATTQAPSAGSVPLVKTRPQGKATPVEAAPPVAAKTPLKPALFGTPAAEPAVARGTPTTGLPGWPRTATQPLVPPVAPAEARRY